MYCLFTRFSKFRLTIDGVGSDPTSLLNTYNALKKAGDTLGQIDAKKNVDGKAVYGKDGEISADEAKTGAKTKATDLQKWTDSYGGSIAPQSEELQRAAQLLAKVKNGEPISAADVKQLELDKTAILDKLNSLRQSALTFSSAPLSEGEAKNLYECIQGKPYLQSLVSVPTGAPGASGNGYNKDALLELKDKLATMDPVQGNAIRSELSYDMALSNLRDQSLGQVKQIDGKLKELQQQLDKPHTMEVDRSIKKEMNKLKIEQVLIDPDLSLKAKVAALKGAGVTEDDQIFKLLKDQQAKVGSQLKDEATKLYGHLGGTGSPPSSMILANGGGDSSLGIKGLYCDQQGNAKPLSEIPLAPQGTHQQVSTSRGPGIGLFQYSDNTLNLVIKGKGGDSITHTKTYGITDSSKETTLHLSSAGSEDYYKTSNIKLSVDGGTPVVLDIHNMDKQQTLPAGWKYDPQTQTLTIPPGTKSLTIIQSSGKETPDGKVGKLPDVFQTNMVLFNAQPLDSHLDLGANYASGSFTLGKLPTDKDKVLGQIAQNVQATWKPGDKITIDARSYGPLDADKFKQGILESTSQIADYEKSGPNSKENLGSVRLVTLDFDADSKTLKLNSGTDPVQWGISSSETLQKKVDALVDAHQTAKPPLNRNSVLGGLRAFAMLEALQGKIGEGKQPDVLAGARVVIGSGADGKPITMSYQQYKDFKALK